MNFEAGLNFDLHMKVPVLEIDYTSECVMPIGISTMKVDNHASK
jgi:hypothetical protein